MAVGDKRHSADLVDLHHILRAYYDRLSEGEPIATIPTGLVDLDKMLLGGFRSGQLVVLAARPSMGKSGLATTIVANAAAKGHPVPVFSLEMSNEENAGRLLAGNARISGSRLSTGRLIDTDWDRASRAVGRMSQWPVAIDDSGRVTLPQLAAKLRRFASRHGRVGLVVVDYLQLMEGHGRSDGRNDEISRISRGLKQLAREFKAPVLALSQLNRKSEERADKRPMMSDLRDSGAIEQDADVILLLHRESQYLRGPDAMSGKAEVHVAKHRNGPVGTVNLYFDRDLASFSNLTLEHSL